MPRHLLHFTAGTLRAMLVEAGFRDVRVRAVGTGTGGALFDTSVVQWLRGLQMARRSVAVEARDGASASAALARQVYGAVSSGGKKAFRWLIRNTAYAPLAVENVIGRSVTLLTAARK